MGHSTNTAVIEDRMHSVAGVLDGAILKILYGVVLVVPLAVFPWALDQALAIKYLLFKSLTALAVALFILRTALYGFKVRTSGLEWAAGAFFVLVALTTVSSLHITTSLRGAFLRYDGLYSHFVYTALFFLCVQYLRNNEVLRRFAAAYIAAGTLVAAYGVLQSSGFDPVPWGYTAFERTRSFATFGNPVLLGAYLSIAFPLALGLMIDEKRGTRKSLLLMSTVTIGLCVLLTMGRGLWVGTLAGLAVIFVFYAKRQSMSLRTIAVPALAALLVMSMAALIVGVPLMASRLESISDAGGSVGSRVSMWRSALHMIAERPLTGHGPDALGTAFSRYEEAGLARFAPHDMQDNVHNAFLQIAATSGMPAALLFLIALVILAIKAARYILTSERFSAVHTGLLAGIIAYVVQSATGVTGIATSTFLWVGMGTLAASWSEADFEIKPVPRAAQIIVAGFAIVLLAAALNSGIREFQADIALGQARLAEAAGHFAEAERAYLSAIERNPSDAKAYRELGILHADAGGISKDRDLWGSGIGYVERAVKLSPRDHMSLMLAGQAYLYGARAFDSRYFYTAERLLTQAVAARPFSYRARTMLAVAYIETDRPEPARQNLAVALDIYPRDPQAHYYMGRYYEEADRRSEALREYRATLALDSHHEKARMAYERLEDGKDRSR